MIVRVALFSVVLLAIAGCGSSVDPAMYAKFQAAQDRFEQATEPRQFLQAAATYQEILDAGLVSSAVLYNQGNAFMRAGERGRAIACYRQAKRHRPRDPYLDANLRYALGEQQAGRSKPIIEYVLFWSEWISYHGKFQLSLACAVITFCLSVAGLYVRPRLLKRIALIALCITIAAVISAAYDWYRFSHIKHGVVIADEVVARKGDSETYQPAFTQPLAEGTEFQVLDQRNGWTHLRLAALQDGWVPSKDVTVY
jgi:tetratricopeptide (TPR) repeat protein